MTARLMTPIELDNAVYELIVRELGIGNAMRFIAQNNRGAGVDYTCDRKDSLPTDAEIRLRLREDARRAIGEMKIDKRRAIPMFAPIIPE
jgi:hypothetical protein